MPVLRVLDGELVQAEFLLERGQLGGLGILQCHPHEAPGLGQVLTDVGHRDVGELLAPFVDDAVDQHVESSSVA